MASFKISREFYLADFESTLFPLQTNAIMVDKFSAGIIQFLQDEVLVEGGGFQHQHRAYASKKGWYLRPTLKLDPVAEFFLYDFVYRNRSLFKKSSGSKRRNLGFRIAEGEAISALESYSSYKKYLAAYRAKYKHRIYFDIASYFNHIYHHDLVRWFEEIGGDDKDVQTLGRFLREIVGGRSIDCLPQGLYPSKMIGSSFLNFIENTTRITCAQTVRLMDDVWLFDEEEETLASDFVVIQKLLAARGLSLNIGKFERETPVGDEELPSDLDEMKIRLLRRRRETVSDSEYGDASDDNENEDELQALTEEEQDYLIGLLDVETIQEEDAELVLTLMREHTSDVIAYLPNLIRNFPNLSKRLYYFCRDADDSEEIASILLNYVRTTTLIGEFQLFWFARMAESYLLKTKHIGELLIALYEHESASDISKSKILEIPEKRFGLIDLREEQLKTGHSDWLAWTAAVGTRGQPKGQRNQMLKYFRKASPMNKLIGEFVESCF